MSVETCVNNAGVSLAGAHGNVVAFFENRDFRVESGKLARDGTTYDSCADYYNSCLLYTSSG